MTQDHPSWLVFFQRTFPSANMILVQGKHPFLIDSGFGSDFPDTAHLVHSHGVSPQTLAFVVNTHYHSDHVGGNFHFQKLGVPIYASHDEAILINNRDVVACSAEWLHQPIEPYTVNQFLFEGDELTSGDTILEVIRTPGHTLGHISFYARQEQILILGDAVHADDVSWINVFREGAGALERTMSTLEMLLRLPVQIAYSGHGPIHQNPHQTMQDALRRYERWQKSPEKIAWHACKRIFSYALMLADGIQKEDVSSFLIQCPWFQDYSRTYFSCSPEEFVQPLIDEMIRAEAAQWHHDKLIPTTRYSVPSKNWYPDPILPRNWPSNS